MAITRYADIASRISLLGFEKAQAQLTSFQTGLVTLSTRASALAKPMLLMGGAMATALGGATIIAAKFEKQMAMVSTQLSGDVGPTMKGFSKGILDLSKKYGESTETLAKGMKDILGASIAPEKALGVLEVSAKAAAASMTDSVVAVKAITTVLNSYGLSADRAGEVSDKLFAIAKRGRTDFGELSSTIGNVAALAAKVGMSFEDLGASIATITRAGISVEGATTAINAMMLAFLKPGPEAAKMALEKFGLELSTTTLKEEGLTGVMRKLKDATEEQLAVMFGSIRGLKGVMVALGDATGYAEDYKLMLNSAGLTEEAFRKMSETLSFQMGQMKQSFHILAVEIGTALIPTAKKLVEIFTGLTEKLENLDDAVKKNAITIGLWTTGAFLAVGGGAALIAITGKIILQYTLLANKIAGGVIAIKAFSLGMGAAAIPMGAMVVALGALAYYLGKTIWAAKEYIDAKNEQTRSEMAAAEAAGKLGDKMKAYLPYIVKASKYKMSDLCGDPRKVKDVENAIKALRVVSHTGDKAMREQAKSQLEAMEKLLDSHYRLGGCVEELTDKQIDNAKKVGRISEEEMKRRIDLARDIVRERSSIEDELLGKIKDIEEEKASIRREIAFREMDREVAIAKSRELATGEAKKYWEEIEDITKTAEILGESYARGDLERKSDALKEWINENEGAQYALQKIGLLGGDVEKERMEERLKVLDKEKSETTTLMEIRLKGLDEIVAKEQLINEIMEARKGLIGPGGKIVPSFYQENKTDVKIDANIEKVGEDLKEEVIEHLDEVTQKWLDQINEMNRAIQARGE